MSRLLLCMAIALLAGCKTVPEVPKQVTVTVTDYRPLPDWIAPVPLHQRSGSSVRDHLTAECRHKQDQATANCLISAARRIVAGEALERGACPPSPPCQDP